MIESSKFALFVAVAWALILAPGPDMLYVMTRGMAYGQRAGIVSAIGVICGILVHTTAAAFGLTLILQTSAFAFRLVKYVGVAYLMYLGLKTWRETSAFNLQSSRSAVSSQQIFWQGVASNVFNPKVAIFFLTFLPQVVDQGSPQVTRQMVFLGLTFASFGLCFLLAIGYSSGVIGAWLIRRPSYTQWLRRLAGSIMIGLGIRLALLERE